MTTDDLRDIALALPGAAEAIKWESHLCFYVFKKMFLITSPDMIPSSAAFRVSTEIFDELTSHTGFKRHFALGRYGWIHLDDINRLNESQWKEYIYESYKLVARNLSKKKRTELGLL